MTVDTSDTLMSARQWEARLCRMIELPRMPIDGVMASIALLTQSASMWIVLRMTSDALTVGITEGLIGMALLTTHFSVRTDQRESRNVMVEP